MHTPIISEGKSTEEKYALLTSQAKSLLEGETDLIANLANLSALIMELFQWHWVGFYLVKDNELVLGPFQGPVACTRISKGKGVCGTAWAEEKTMIVDDVNKFPGHIACSAYSQSEIVVPLFINGKVIGVLDIDSSEKASFSEIDQQHLKSVLEHLS